MREKCFLLVDDECQVRLRTVLCFSTVVIILLPLRPLKQVLSIKFICFC